MAFEQINTIAGLGRRADRNTVTLRENGALAVARDIYAALGQPRRVAIDLDVETRMLRVRPIENTRGGTMLKQLDPSQAAHGQSRITLHALQQRGFRVPFKLPAEVKTDGCAYVQLQSAS